MRRRLRIDLALKIAKQIQKYNHPTIQVQGLEND